MPSCSRIPTAVAIMLLVLVTSSLPVWAEADPFDELAPNAPKTGSQAPLFTAEEAFGITISLREELKEHNVLLLFYRGVF